MNRLYIVAMSLLAVAGVMSVMAATDTTGRVIGIVITASGLAGVFAAIMSRKKNK
ncbi:hypothetical protein V3C33_03560 [Micrococcaceae bacterium Sec5.7]